MTSLETTDKLLAFYGPERMLASSTGETFHITTEMQAHAERHGYDRAKADAEAATKSTAVDEAAKPARGRKE